MYRFQPNFAQHQGPQSARRGWFKCAPNEFKMSDGRHFETVKSPYLHKRLTDFDEISYADAEPVS